MLAKYREGYGPDLPPFQRGAAGFLACNLNRTLERLPAPATPVNACPSPFYISMTWSSATTITTTDAGSFLPDRRDTMQRAGATAYALEPLSLQHCLPAGSRRGMSAGHSGRMAFEFQSVMAIAPAQRVIDLILLGTSFQANIASASVPGSQVHSIFLPFANECGH
ncbi:hypothetical protein ABIC03_007912 [Bradyrhizobium sp. RT6a]|uniref:hypothetical protein n=1 Tax=Bradyrhizobium sp. RT6a TaxID=3156381 RepID=UPI00339B13E2